MSTCTREMDFFPANYMLQSHQEQEHHSHIHNPTSLIINTSPNMLPPQDFPGTIGSFLGKRSMSFAGVDHQVLHDMNGDHVDELSDQDEDDGSGAGGSKKRRLKIEQVRTLEKSFEQGNKLEPDRKLELSRALGLQPRQIAIWFQNRRARWKTKQLEKDYELLKSQFDALKAENDSLRCDNQRLHVQILAIKNREPTESINLNKETEGSSSNRTSTENSSEIKQDYSRTPPAIDSHPPKITSIPLFSPNNNKSNFVRLQQPTFRMSRPSDHHRHHQQSVKEEHFSNMFTGVDDQTAFWPWIDQQPFN